MLKLELNIPDPDSFYEAFIQAHEQLDAEGSRDFDLRLIFLLANQVSSQEILLACIAAAAETAPLQYRSNRNK